MAVAEKRPRVLLVDDEPWILMVTADIIDDLGFEAVPALNADIAISILEKRDDIGLVFTDVNMPGGIDGIGLAQTVRNRWPPVKIAVTSGRPLDRAHLLPAGCLFLEKPYRQPDVQDMLRVAFA